MIRTPKKVNFVDENRHFKPNLHKYLRDDNF